MTKAKEKALELILEGSYTMEEISHCVKRSRKTLYNWLNNDDEFADELQRKKADFERMNNARMSRLVTKALKRAEYILEHSKNDIAAASVIKDILDRTGYTATTVYNVDGAEPIIIINDIPKDI